MSELYINASVSHDSDPTVWERNGQFVVDLGATGVRFDSHMGFRFDDPADSDNVEPMFQANVDRCVELGLKMSIIVGPYAVRSAAWEAIGGDWQGHIPWDVDWRAHRVPNHAGVNAKLLEWIVTNIGYAIQQLGIGNVEVEAGNEPRDVARTGGDPNTTLTANANSDILQVAASGGFVEAGAASWVIVETNPRQYAKVVELSDPFTIAVDRTVTANSGTVVRQGDWYHNDGQVDLDYMAQISGIIVGLKAAFPTLKVNFGSVFQLGQANVVGGIDTYLDWIAALNPATYPGLSQVDGWSVNIYKTNPAGAYNLSGRDYAEKYRQLTHEVWMNCRSRAEFGMDSKPWNVTEFGATMEDLGLASAGLPKSELHRGDVMRMVIDAMRGSHFGRVCLFAANDSGVAGPIPTNSFGFMDNTGAVSSAIARLARTRSVSSSVVPSGYANAGGSYLTSDGSGGIL